MSRLASLPKRIVIGRPFRSDRLGETLLPKRLALPIFASDPMSSVAYATQEILIVLSLAGAAYLKLTPWLGAMVVILLVTVVASYRQLVVAYPTGGGDYEVASRNLGSRAGLVVASALLVDYVLTVAVSVSSGVDNIISALPGLNGWRVHLAIGFVLLLMALNLRGTRESGNLFAVPTYAFVVGVFTMIAFGMVQTVRGSPPVAESAHYGITPTEGFESLTGLGVVFLALRAFSSGCTALTGVEAIANGVPAFRPPKARNAQRTLVMMGAIAGTMFSGVTALALLSHVRVADDPCSLTGFPNCGTQPQKTVIAQLAGAVFSGPTEIGFYYIQAATAAILILAANTAFNGFPLLGSILAQHRYLPRQLHTRGDRLAFSNGIMLLAGFAGLLILIFHASVTHLIQLYIIGVFVSFTLGQSGMVVHWTRLLKSKVDSVARRRMTRSRAINATGASLTGVVLVIVTVTKFTHGAWIAIAAMPVLFLTMSAIHRHYARVAVELAPQVGAQPVLPSRVHAVVLVSRVHKPSLRALAFARASRPDTLEAVTVNVDETDHLALQQAWERFGLDIPLVVLDSPYREVTEPLLAHVRNIRRESPRDLVDVYIPEYVVGKWWENLLHNQSALRLKTRLRYIPGVVLTSVPWQLESSEEAARRSEQKERKPRRKGKDAAAKGDDSVGDD